MPSSEDKLRYGCEDLAWGNYLYAGTELWLASIAVSMKRIADLLEKQGAPKTGPLDPFNWPDPAAKMRELEAAGVLRDPPAAAAEEG